MIVKLYRKYVSPLRRAKIYDAFLERLLSNFRDVPSWYKGIYIYIFSPFYPKNEYYDAYRFIGKHGVTFYPFKTSIKYAHENIFIKKCEGRGEVNPYVEHNGKKLYFPRQMDEMAMRHMYWMLIKEQDPNSPHRYVKSYEELKGKTLLDLGAAEGIFALDAIEHVRKVYLFECDEKWIEPLRMTFAPWKEKVEFVYRYVSDKDDDENITLDSFMKGKEQDGLHIKMDIEGAELSALQGATQLLSGGTSIALSVCTYHKADDAENIPRFLSSLGYSCEFTRGFMFLSPYMRKAMCRGKK
jgi:hypothetical protein